MLLRLKALNGGNRLLEKMLAYFGLQIMLLKEILFIKIEWSSEGKEMAERVGRRLGVWITFTFLLFGRNETICNYMPNLQLKNEWI
ncbi:MAG: hypothetical protein WCO61_02975 [Alphaproteobacteria bacterium]